jgi:hypothetical protein
MNRIVNWLYPKILCKGERNYQEKQRVFELVPHGMAICEIGRTINYSKPDLVRILLLVA